MCHTTRTIVFAKPDLLMEKKESDVYDACYVRQFERDPHSLLKRFLQPSATIYLDIDAFLLPHERSQVHVPLSSLKYIDSSLYNHPIVFNGQRNTLRAWCSLYMKSELPDLSNVRLRILQTDSSHLTPTVHVYNHVDQLEFHTEQTFYSPHEWWSTMDNDDVVVFQLHDVDTERFMRSCPAFYIDLMQESKFHLLMNPECMIGHMEVLQFELFWWWILRSVLLLMVVNIMRGLIAVVFAAISR